MRRDPADPIISRIDKSRRSAGQKAHDEMVRLSAYKVTTRLLATVSSADRHYYRDGMLDAIRDNGTADVGPVSASTQLSKRAEQPIIAPDAVARAVRSQSARWR
jgi:hypothetical protein